MPERIPGASYGYYIFSGDYVAENGLSYSHLFLAEGWIHAELTAKALGLKNLGKVKGIYPATADDLAWAQKKGTPN